MRIEAIRVRTYKSLYDLTLHPSKFTVLAGPNSAGKSNIVDAIGFVADVHRFGLDLAVQAKGGFENIAHRRIRRSKNPICFEITAILSSREVGTALMRVMRGSPGRTASNISHNPVLISYCFSLRSPSESVTASFHVKEEHLIMRELGVNPEPEQLRLDWDGGGQDLVRVHRQGATIEVESLADERGRSVNSFAYPFALEGFREFLTTEAVKPGLILTALRFNPLISYYTERMGRVRVYQINALEARRPGVPTAVADLERHGANLPTVISYMQRTSPQSWKEVMRAMRRIVPGLQDITVNFTHDRRLTLIFGERGTGRPWTIEEVSDGTIQSLAMFVAVNDRRSPLLVVEEPENSLHPWILKVFVDTCRAASGRQTVLTTHSPALLSRVAPEDVTVVWRRNGRTQARGLLQLYPKARVTWESGKGTVFDILDSGLVAEDVPPSE
jgi:predicted ATPase